MICQSDWWDKHGAAAVNHFGRITKPIKLTEENAWYKFRDWRCDDNNQYYFANDLLGERRPITEQQYQDENYTTPN